MKTWDDPHLHLGAHFRDLNTGRVLQVRAFDADEDWIRLMPVPAEPGVLAVLVTYEMIQTNYVPWDISA